MLFFKKKKPAEDPTSTSTSTSAPAPAKGETKPMTDKPVMLYALSTCSHCKSTKKLLDDCGVKYDFVYVDQAAGDERKNLVEAVKKYNPSCSFPTLVVGDTIIVGFKEQDIKEALGL